MILNVQIKQLFTVLYDWTNTVVWALNPPWPSQNTLDFSAIF